MQIEQPNIIDVIPAYRWGDKTYNLAEITQLDVANSVIAHILHPQTIHRFRASDTMISFVCDAFCIDRQLIEERGYKDWEFFVQSTSVNTPTSFGTVVRQLPDHSKSACGDFINCARELLLTAEEFFQETSELARLARLSSFGTDALQTGFGALQLKTLPKIANIWVHQANQASIRTLKFRTPRARFDGKGIIKQGIDIDFSADPDTPSSPAPYVMKEDIDHCTKVNNADDTTGLGFIMGFRSVVPLLKGTEASLSVRNPGVIPKPLM